MRRDNTLRDQGSILVWVLGSSEQVNAGSSLYNPRSGWKHKAWRGAKRNPRIPNDEKTERAERAIAQMLRFTHDEWLSPTSRALFLCSDDPGVPLRSTPGFMLSPRFAGSMQLFTLHYG
jgi:hypothetical protein